ncbi:MAG: pyridoxal-phosphate dependent enzyme [Ilumatobacteraceae bacterium]
MGPDDSTSIGVDDIRDAAVVVADVIKHTPVVASLSLTHRAGGEVVLKAENLQVTGAFKIRGATNKLATLQRRGTFAGVTAASAGNHALALAPAARAAHVPCEIFVPIGAPITKIEAAQKFGAVIHEVAPSLEDALALAVALVGGVRVCPVPSVRRPCRDRRSGDARTRAARRHRRPGDGDRAARRGGLASGIAIAVKSARPQVRVVGVQTAACAPYAGGTTRSGPIATLADGIAVKHPGIVTGPLVEQWLDEVVTVDEEAIAGAMVLLMDRAKLYVEGAGAVGVAALLAGTVDAGSERDHLRGAVGRQRRPRRRAGTDPAPRDVGGAASRRVRQDRRPPRWTRAAARRVRRRRRQPHRRRAPPGGREPARSRDRGALHVRSARSRSRRHDHRAPPRRPVTTTCESTHPFADSRCLSRGWR